MGKWNSSPGITSEDCTYKSVHIFPMRLSIITDIIKFINICKTNTIAE